MRSPRLKLHDCSAVYHCVSRIVGGQFLLGDLEKEQFRRQTWLLADFCGVEALGYSVMSDHFHLAIRVPAPGPVSDEEIARRLRVLYPKRHPDVRAVEADLKLRGRIAPKLRKRLLQRMGDISMYLKELKQRFTRWYNRQHERYGTIWAERFKSVLVEDQPEAILTLLFG